MYSVIYRTGYEIHV